MQHLVGDCPAEASVKALKKRKKLVVATVLVHGEQRTWQLDPGKMTWREGGAMNAIRAFFGGGD